MTSSQTKSYLRSDSRWRSHFLILSLLVPPHSLGWCPSHWAVKRDGDR